MKMIGIILKTMFIFSPKIVVELLKKRRYSFAISTIIANPITLIIGVAIAGIFGGIWVAAISTVGYIVIGTIYNWCLIKNADPKDMQDACFNISNKIMKDYFLDELETL